METSKSKGVHRISNLSLRCLRSCHTSPMRLLALLMSAVFGFGGQAVASIDSAAQRLTTSLGGIVQTVMRRAFACALTAPWFRRLPGSMP